MEAQTGVSGVGRRIGIDLSDARTDTSEASEADRVEAAEERDFARRIMREEIGAIERAAAALGPDFTAAVDLIDRATASGGSVIVSGLGKSGLIGGKIAATLSSLGHPAHAVHPTEAAHGDLGRFRAEDVAILISHSGETEEVVGLAATLKQDGIPVIAITRGRADQNDPRAVSGLERLADAVLSELVDEEATQGSLLAPTSSTTVTLVLGDALALALARRRNFTDEDFARRHPGGQLGGLLRPVVDLLRFESGRNLPLITPDETVEGALRHASEGERRPGALLIVDGDDAAHPGKLVGIFTDGDLRRLVLNDPEKLTHPIGEVMTANPRTLPATALARDAVLLVREHRADEIPVVDEEHRPIGLLDVQDLIAMRLVKA